MEDDVILVDPQDRVIGLALKSPAHTLGLRHRAFSVVLVDKAGHVLLQRRAREKYHSAGLWANSCCGHPRPGESTHDAAVRRTREELGVSVSLTKAGVVTYRLSVSATMIEHEIDHVFVGSAVGEIEADRTEVWETAWVSIEDLARDMAHRPDRYAVWLSHVLGASCLWSVGN